MQRWAARRNLAAGIAAALTLTAAACGRSTVPVVSEHGLATPASSAAAARLPEPGGAGSRRNPPLALSRRCFYAASPAGRWPLEHRTALRASFNEPRGPVHFGIDVAAPTDQAAVYAIESGTVTVATRGHFNVVDVPRQHEFSYWHVRRAPGIVAGAWVWRGEPLGHTWHNFFHVHISEWVRGCGFVDPRRPTGVFHQPLNTERPAIGPLTAYVANAAAWRLPDHPARLLARRPSDYGLHDPAAPLSLGRLHGRVDFRSSVLDVPRVKMGRFRQVPFAPSVVRGWLAPLGHRGHRYGPLFQWSGATYIQAGPAPGFRDLRHLWAFGTWRSNACFFHPRIPADYCGMDIVYHVGGPHGFDTRRVRDGRYEYCVGALTINNAAATRCTAVTVSNG